MSLFYGKYSVKIKLSFVLFVPVTIERMGIKDAAALGRSLTYN